MRGGKMKAPARDKPLVGGSSPLGPTRSNKFASKYGEHSIKHNLLKVSLVTFFSKKVT